MCQGYHTCHASDDPWPFSFWVIIDDPLPQHCEWQSMTWWHQFSLRKLQILLMHTFPIATYSVKWRYLCIYVAHSHLLACWFLGWTYFAHTTPLSACARMYWVGLMELGDEFKVYHWGAWLLVSLYSMEGFWGREIQLTQSQYDMAGLRIYSKVARRETY